jgi:CheY-like chemotaxis protein
MESPPSTIRGLINDLTRTLTGSLVHMDDLLLQLDNDSEEFDDAWLANHQLERALEFFIELRSEYMIRQESINQKKTKSYKSTAVDVLSHNFNNLLAVIIGYCDIMQNSSAHVQQICQNVDLIYQSIQNSHYFLNKSICLSGRNISINKSKLFNRKYKLTKTASYNKYNLNRNLLLVEDDEGVKDIMCIVLRNHKYSVVTCSRGDKALAIIDQYKANFALYIVDIGLPDIEGPDLVNKLLLKKQNINVLFTSGYDETKLKAHYPLIGRYPILSKPFQLAELLNKIKSIILH